MPHRPHTARRPVRQRLNQEPTHITWVREARNVSKRELGAAIGKAESLIGEIEKGTRNATPAVLLAMAEYLGCPVSMLERRIRPSALPTEVGRALLDGAVA